MGFKVSILLLCAIVVPSCLGIWGILRVGSIKDRDLTSLKSAMIYDRACANVCTRRVWAVMD